MQHSNEETPQKKGSQESDLLVASSDDAESDRLERVTAIAFFSFEGVKPHPVDIRGELWESSEPALKGDCSKNCETGTL